MTLTNTELHVPVRKNGEGSDRPKARKGVLRQAMFRPESKGRVELSWRTAWGGACGLTGSSRKGPVVGGYVRWHGQRAEGQEELRRRCSSTCYLADQKQSPTPKLHVGTPLLPGSSGWAARPSRGGRLCSPSPLASHRAPGWHLARGLPLCVALSILLTGPEGPGEGVGAGVSGSCYPASLGAGGVGRTLNAARGACG